MSQITHTSNASYQYHTGYQVGLQERTGVSKGVLILNCNRCICRWTRKCIKRCITHSPSASSRQWARWWGCAGAACSWPHRTRWPGYRCPCMETHPSAAPITTPHSCGRKERGVSGGKERKSCRRENGVCFIPPLFYLRVSQVLTHRTLQRVCPRPGSMSRHLFSSPPANPSTKSRVGKPFPLLGCRSPRGFALHPPLMAGFLDAGESRELAAKSGSPTKLSLNPNFTVYIALVAGASKELH